MSVNLSFEKTYPIETFQSEKSYLGPLPNKREWGSCYLNTAVKMLALNPFLDRFLESISDRYHAMKSESKELFRLLQKEQAVSEQQYLQFAKQLEKEGFYLGFEPPEVERKEGRSFCDVLAFFEEMNSETFPFAPTLFSFSNQEPLSLQNAKVELPETWSSEKQLLLLIDRTVRDPKTEDEAEYNDNYIENIETISIEGIQFELKAVVLSFCGHSFLMEKTSHKDVCWIEHNDEYVGPYREGSPNCFSSHEMVGRYAVGLIYDKI
ncbi:MAG: hypothetical protein Tsb0021_02020 [Chlamydiales bacterium]